jgi:hypothetical protein
MHHFLCGSSSVGRASAFQAECREFESRLPLHRFYEWAQVERILGKDEVAGSNPALGSRHFIELFDYLNEDEQK